LADVLLRTDELKKHLPKFGKDAVAGDPYVKLGVVDDYDERMLEAETALLEVCASIAEEADAAAATDPLPPGYVVTTNTATAAGGGMLTPLFVSPIPAPAPRSEVSTSLASTKALFKGTTQLWGVRLKQGPAGLELIRGELSDMAEHMMTCGSIKDMSRSFTAALAQTEKTFHDSCHFLLRTANLPLLQATVTGYIATGLVHELPLKSLGEKVFQGFSIIMMLADSK
jgi:hypothetical protein